MKTAREYKAQADKYALTHKWKVQSEDSDITYLAMNALDWLQDELQEYWLSVSTGDRDAGKIMLELVEMTDDEVAEMPEADWGL